MATLKPCVAFRLMFMKVRFLVYWDPMARVNPPRWRLLKPCAIKPAALLSVDGFDLDKEPDSIKKIIGVQLQTSGFYPNLNLLELIDLFTGLYNQ